MFEHDYFIFKIKNMAKNIRSTIRAVSAQTGVSEYIWWTYALGDLPFGWAWVGMQVIAAGRGAYSDQIDQKNDWSDIEVILSFLIIFAYRTYFEVSILWEATESHGQRPKGINIVRSPLFALFT